MDSVLGERVLAEGETSGRRHFCLVAAEDGLPRAAVSIVNSTLSGTSSTNLGQLHPIIKVHYKRCSSMPINMSGREDLEPHVLRLPEQILDEALDSLEESTLLLPEGSREYAGRTLGHLVW